MAHIESKPTNPSDVEGPLSLAIDGVRALRQAARGAVISYFGERVDYPNPGIPEYVEATQPEGPATWFINSLHTAGKGLHSVVNGLKEQFTGYDVLATAVQGQPEEAVSAPVQIA